MPEQCSVVSGSSTPHDTDNGVPIPSHPSSEQALSGPSRYCHSLNSRATDIQDDEGNDIPSSRNAPEPPISHNHGRSVTSTALPGRQPSEGHDTNSPAPDLGSPQASQGNDMRMSDHPMETDAGNENSITSHTNSAVDDEQGDGEEFSPSTPTPYVHSPALSRQHQSEERMRLASVLSEQPPGINMRDDIPNITRPSLPMNGEEHSRLSHNMLQLSTSHCHNPPTDMVKTSSVVSLRQRQVEEQECAQTNTSARADANGGILTTEHQTHAEGNADVNSSSVILQHDCVSEGDYVENRITTPVHQIEVGNTGVPSAPFMETSEHGSSEYYTPSTNHLSATNQSAGQHHIQSGTAVTQTRAGSRGTPVREDRSSANEHSISPGYTKEAITNDHIAMDSVENDYRLHTNELRHPAFLDAPWSTHDSHNSSLRIPITIDEVTRHQDHECNMASLNTLAATPTAETELGGHPFGRGPTSPASDAALPSLRNFLTQDFGMQSRPPRSLSQPLPSPNNEASLAPSGGRLLPSCPPHIPSQKITLPGLDELLSRDQHARWKYARRSSEYIPVSTPRRVQNTNPLNPPADAIPWLPGDGLPGLQPQTHPEQLMLSSQFARHDLEGGTVPATGPSSLGQLDNDAANTPKASDPIFDLDNTDLTLLAIDDGNMGFMDDWLKNTDSISAWINDPAFATVEELTKSVN